MMLATQQLSTGAALPAPVVHALRQEARAELAAEWATAEVQRLQRELDYAIQTARQAAHEAARARQLTRAALEQA